MGVFKGMTGTAVLGRWPPLQGRLVRPPRSATILARALARWPDPMAIIRVRDGTLAEVVEINEVFAHELGHPRSELIGKSPVEAGFWEDTPELRKLADAVQRKGMLSDFPVRLHSEGRARDVLLTARSVQIDRAEFVVLVARSATAPASGNAELALHPLQDPLTGLPSRVILLDRLTNALHRAERQNTRVAVLTLNIDRFRVINHSLGHRIGDALLMEVARRIDGCLRREDTICRLGDTVSRIGADEFTILLEGLSREEGASKVIDRIHKVLEPPFELEEHQLSITAGFGLALSGGGTVQPEALLQQAGIAMRRAKTAGPDRRHVFDPAVDVREAHRLRLENDLREAVGKGELVLRFQPIIALDTGKIAGLETLVRWVHPEFGVLAPMEFIPVAEESGLILSLGGWVLREACRQASRWQEKLGPESPLNLAVNISAQELRDPRFVDLVRRTLLATGLEPTCLQFEITERLLVQSSPALNRLKGLKVKLVVDDFGTGYSSLNYLARMPVDAIKIDRSFISELGKSSEAGPLVGAMMAMAKTLHLDVVAEGIETVEQLTEVWKLGCPYGQGFLFRKPLCSEEVDELLEENPRFAGKTMQAILKRS